MFKVKEINVTSIVDKDPNVYVMRAEDNLKLHKYQEALREMDQAIEYAPTNQKENYAFEKIKILDVIGWHSDSVDFIKKYLKRFYSELPLSDFYRVLRVLKKNSTSDLFSILKQNGIPTILLEVYQSERSDEAFFKQKAREYLSKDQFSNAFAMTKLISEKSGFDSDLCLLNGQIYKAQGTFSGALSYFLKAADFRDPQLEVFIEIADTYVILEKINEAQIWIEKGLAAFPFNNKLLHFNAKLYYRSNQYDLCLLVLNDILKKEPNDAEAFYMKGLIYDYRKRYLLANSNFKKAKIINPSLKEPENREKKRFLHRMKIFVVSISIAILLLLIGQFVLFKTGMIKPIVKGAILKTDDILFLGKTMQIYDDYDYFPSYAKKPKMKYRIKDPHIAKVSSYGEIKGLKVGTTSVQLLEGNRVLASSEIKVVKPEVLAITIELTNNNLVVGEKEKLTTKVEMDYEDAEIPKITYSSSNPSVISVNQDGEIETLDIGEATIKASVGGKSSSFTVHSYAKVDEILLEDLIVEIGNSLTLKPTVKTTPEDGEIYPLKYETLDSSIATVNTHGEVTGVSAGEVEIVISSFNGVEKRVKVLVEINSPSDLTATFDMETQTIHLNWDYDFTSNESVQFELSGAIANNDYSEILTSKETSAEFKGVSGEQYSFRVQAIVGDRISMPAFVSLTVPEIYKEDSNNMDSDSKVSDSNYEEAEGSKTVSKTPEEIQKDKDVENMIKLMSSVEGYWKNASPNDSDYRDLKYALISNSSTESRKDSFGVSLLAKSYYDGVETSFWEYGLRSNLIKIDGNKLIDSDEDTMTIHNPNMFTIEISGKTLTFIRCKKTDIPNDYLINRTVELP
ncbi:Ig-like domain-containing protein [Bacillus massiliigorillae]|uniref:Ig-like domain-containing protein n=1 Tax=Bacillus massiliigorillae TaxID=1243664 RepID=UPI00039D5BAE|nr:Ig-like domain-containing protein [Bacillus massiliigorillae]